jgi:deoxyribonuclease V
MLACLDVDYRAGGTAKAACLTFETWTAPRAASAHTIVVTEPPGDYQPGAFYLRELPCLQAVLALVTVPLQVIVVDAYVTLDPAGRPGLGARLHEALGEVVSVVGVAKTRFATATHAEPILRGSSQSPLWITAACMDIATAAAHVRSMHGPHRVPTLLREVDRLAREP